MDQFFPYLERMGAAAGVIFFALYLRETIKRDAITKQLIDYLPKLISAMEGTKTSLDLMRERIVTRDGARREFEQRDS